MLQNVILQRTLGPHNCTLSLYFSDKCTTMEDNTKIYCFNENKYVLYQIMSIENDLLICQQISTKNTTFDQTRHLQWEKVGVFEKSESQNVLHNIAINKNDVHGKVIQVYNYLITCPANVLREK